jgi:hypothetical protein
MCRPMHLPADLHVRHPTGPWGVGAWAPPAGLVTKGSRVQSTACYPHSAEVCWPLPEPSGDDDCYIGRT